MTDRRRRRHPAAASRILAVGASTASALALTGVLALAEPPNPDLTATVPVDRADATGVGTSAGVARPDPLPSPAGGRKVVVVVRRRILVPDPSAATGVTPRPASPAATSRNDPARRPMPVTRTRGS